MVAGIGMIGLFPTGAADRPGTRWTLRIAALLGLLLPRAARGVQPDDAQGSVPGVRTDDRQPALLAGRRGAGPHSRVRLLRVRGVERGRTGHARLWGQLPKRRAVTGALAGAGCARAGVSISVHLVLAGAAMVAGTVVAVRSFLSSTVDDAPTGSRARSQVLAAWREPRTLLLGLLVLVMAFTEEAANDWLAVAFRRRGTGSARRPARRRSASSWRR